MLNDKQTAYCRAYVEYRSKTKAALKAGYSKKTASQAGYRLHQNPEVVAEIDRLSNVVLATCGSKSEDVIHELKLLSHSNLEDFIDIDSSGAVTAKPWEDISKEKRKIIKMIREKRIIKSTSEGDEIMSITIEYTLWDKVKPLEMLGRYHKLFTDKVETSSKNPEAAQIDRTQYSDDDLKKIIDLKKKVAERKSAG